MVRTNQRGLTAVEVAIGLAILGTLVAIAIPACVREMHASKFAEPVNGLARIGKNATALCSSAEATFPESTPLTPEKTPRGKMEVDPAGTWDHPTWKALDFRATPDGVPHAFSFQVDGKPEELIARAHGDLDGDGVTSTFEVRCVRDQEGARVLPGMYVDAEVE
jgi:prepilin-type N-terminal cleavage/methylation domain-containing protein